MCLDSGPVLFLIMIYLSFSFFLHTPTIGIHLLNKTQRNKNAARRNLSSGSNVQLAFIYMKKKKKLKAYLPKFTYLPKSISELPVINYLPGT